VRGAGEPRAAIFDMDGVLVDSECGFLTMAGTATDETDRKPGKLTNRIADLAFFGDTLMCGEHPIVR
jgi:hypothetical protein